MQRDLVEGGAFTLRMEVAGGKVYHVFGTYREVDFPRRLVYTWDLEEAEDWVGETLVTVAFRMTCSGESSGWWDWGGIGGATPSDAQ